ncbi:hypothetical protein [Methylobacterium sp. J-070]|uniref:hypothetical protein n=1 Tax=Methylobacterium sp. J-070 TaxID=2836650 RepID=UPI001FB99614|nr:hypothetical protein [Methylobacterium sp. J-070]MCJ2051773.1 hypothetical protein [Methylobacterium sp. J-070]
MSDFDHILNWKLLRGSHDFPGPTGGTCINEAAVVACGFPYQRVSSVKSMPDCFSRPICRLAMQLNDEATDAQRQRLLPFVTRLGCADTPEIERQRERYISRRINLDSFCPVASYQFGFDEGLVILEGALAIGRQADPLGLDEAASRLDAARGTDASAKKRTGFLSTKMKSWLSRPQALENID